MHLSAASHPKKKELAHMCPRRSSSPNPRDPPTVMSHSGVVPHMQKFLFTVAKGPKLDAVELRSLVVSELKRYCSNAPTQDEPGLKRVLLQEVAMCKFLMTMKDVNKHCRVRDRCAFYVTPSSRMTLPEYDDEAYASTSEIRRLTVAMYKSSLQKTYDELVALSVLATRMKSWRKVPIEGNHVVQIKDKHKVHITGIWVDPPKGAIKKGGSHVAATKRPTNMFAVGVFVRNQLAK